MRPLTSRHIDVLWIFLLAIFLSSCFPRFYKVPKGQIQHEKVAKEYMAGAGQIDITPPPATSMGGFGSDIGKITRGYFGRLYAKSTYLEDKKGNYVIIVACDLWSFPQGLGDRVMVQLRKNQRLPFDIARENILFAATHTHHSAGNFSTSIGYNLGSSTVAGFHRDQFHFLAKSIAASIEEAYLGREPVTLSFAVRKVIGLTRNRSLDAFLENPSQEIAQFRARINNADEFVSNTPECLADKPDHFAAIDPWLTTLVIKSKANHLPIALINNFSVHPTSLGSENVLASADLFGVATLTIKNYLLTHYGPYENNQPVISFLNGSEGDISPNWTRLGRRESLRIGRKLAKRVISNMESRLEPITGNIRSRLKFVTIKNQWVADKERELVCDQNYYPKTAKTPLIGHSILKGAEDGRVEKEAPINECHFNEAVFSHKCHKAHGRKKKYLPGIFNILLKSSAPQKVPIGLYDIGNVRMIAMPGETTVALGERLKRAAKQGSSNHVLLVGLANEYISYFTTPPEYGAQHYEGASTIYGSATGIFLEEKLVDIVNQSANQNLYHGLKKYTPGMIFAPYKQKKVEQSFKQAFFNLRYYLKSMGDEDLEPNNDFLHYQWPNPEVVNYSSLPSVHIEILKNGQWNKLELEKRYPGYGYSIMEVQDDRHSHDVVSYISGNGKGLNRWETLWYLPNRMRDISKVRFVLSINDETYFSDILSLPPNR